MRGPTRTVLLTCLVLVTGAIGVSIAVASATADAPWLSTHPARIAG